MQQAILRRRRAMAALGATLLAWSLPGQAQPAADAPPLRIGVYDSRAVAVAYAGSAVMARRLAELKARHQQALQAGDTALAARVQAEGQAWQAQLHRQGFGTAPVDDLLAHIASELPAVQQAAGVSCLVSKWNRAELALHPQAQQVDVTLALVDAFHPTARQRRYAVQIQSQAPKQVQE